MSSQTHRFIDALHQKPVDCTPVWIMRQAGRYLPEYREVRSKVKDFLELCQTPALAAEVTLQPLRRFDLDASIIFSDILVVPAALGVPLSFVEGEGPKLEPITSLSALNALQAADARAPMFLAVYEAIERVQSHLAGRIPLIGFAGSPWTLAAYTLEGQGSKEFMRLRRVMYEQPELLESLLDRLTASVTLFLSGQAKAGTQALMIFDSWGGLLPPHLYARYAIAPMKKIIAELRAQGIDLPMIVFSRGAALHLEAQIETGAHALGLDWTVDLGQARARVGDRVALQGNLDPAALFSSPDRLKHEIERILQPHRGIPGHIFNLGHGIHQHTDPQQVATLIEAVHRF